MVSLRSFEGFGAFGFGVDLNRSSISVSSGARAIYAM